MHMPEVPKERLNAQQCTATGILFFNSIEEKESKWGCVFNPAPKGGQTTITEEK